MVLRFAHVIVYVSRLFFLLLNSIPLYGCTIHFVHSLVDGHLFFSQFFIIMNTALNIHIQFFVWTYIFIYLEYKAVSFHYKSNIMLVPKIFYVPKYKLGKSVNSLITLSWGSDCSINNNYHFLSVLSICQTLCWLHMYITSNIYI